MTELCRNHRLKLHRLMRYGMIEAQHVGMKAQTMYWVIAIAVLHIATNRMIHICRMNTNLILPSRFKLELNKTVFRGAVKSTEMCYGIFSSVVNR